MRQLGKHDRRNTLVEGKRGVEGEDAARRACRVSTTEPPNWISGSSNGLVEDKRVVGTEQVIQRRR
jgi:hypothetical protein